MIKMCVRAVCRMDQSDVVCLVARATFPRLTAHREMSGGVERLGVVQ